MDNIKRKCNTMMDLLKFIFNKKILNKVVACWHPILQPAFNFTWRVKG